MTISTQDSKVNYQGNGQTTVFQIPFPFLENNQIYVQKKDAQDNLINYTYATDYTVTGAGEENGGSVTLNVAPEQGSTISIYRNVPLTQEVDYRENEIFPAETHEEALDKLTMEVQQIQEQLDRSVKVDRFSDVDLDIFVNEIERVYNSTDNIDIVANNINDVNTVSGNIANVNTAATNIAAIQDAPNQAISAQNSASQAAQSAQTATNKADEASESARQAVSALSLQIGDVCFVPLGIDESLNLRRYLNGQVIIQSQFVAFTNKVKSAIALYPNLATTEENWQAEKTNSKLGQCGKFVVDDTAGTIRLPCVVNAQGLVDLALIGGIKAESLPNITGEIQWLQPRDTTSTPVGTGAFSTENLGMVSASGDSPSTGTKVIFNASRSSSTYQDNAPVQQEAVQYPYCIQVATGVEEELPAIREYKINTPFFFGQSMYSDVAPDNASWLVSNGQYNARSVYPDYYDWLLTQYNNPTESNVIKVGSVTDNNGVLGGFSNNNYALTPSGIDLNSVDTFEICMCFTGDSGSILQGNGNNPFTVAVSDGDCLVHLQGQSDWSNVASGIVSGGSTKKWRKLEFTGSAYNYYTSSNGQTFELAGTLNSSTKIISATKQFVIGTNDVHTDPFNGSIDLNECYININGQRWWNGRKAIVVKTGETSISSDYDFIVNTADQTFRLPLLNGEEDLPSNRYDDLTLQASGSTYTAPANGWFSLDTWTTSTATAYYQLRNLTSDLALLAVPDQGHAYQQKGFIPCRAGDVVALVYSNTDTTRTNWHFVYAKGNGTLYYYVGDTVQDASLINAGAVLGQLSNKADASQFQVVSALPANPDTNVFYFIPE